MKSNLVSKIVILIVLTCLSSNVFAKESESSYNYNYASFTGRCTNYDPYEGFNRKIYFFNGVLDTFILRPITKGYGALTNDYTKNRVSNAIDNIKTPLTTFNYILQGNVEGSYKSFWRFAVNSTFGVLGLFDVASKVGLAADPQTFGSTLAHYGVGPGPYIVLPIYGGTVARDMTDSLFTNSALNLPNYYMSSGVSLGVAIVGTVSARDRIMPFTDYVSKNSPDSYIAIRDAILSQREAKVKYPEDFKCPSVN